MRGKQGKKVSTPSPLSLSLSLSLFLSFSLLLSGKRHETPISPASAPLALLSLSSILYLCASSRRCGRRLWFSGGFLRGVLISEWTGRRIVRAWLSGNYSSFLCKVWKMLYLERLYRCRKKVEATFVSL